MTNYPQPRKIPAGKVLLSEYGEPDYERAVVDTIAEGKFDHPGCDDRKVYLIWSSPGFEPAGSMARWTNGYWAVIWHGFGARQGKRFLPNDEGEAKARADFAHKIAYVNPYIRAA